MKKQISDEQKLITLLDEFGIEYDTYTEPEFIMEEALDNGAVRSVSIRGILDFAFKKNGTLVGTFTSAPGSFRKHKDVESIQGLLKIK